MDQYLSRVLSRSKIEFYLADLFEEVHVVILMPDLSKAPYDVWGDWGPMYRLHLAGDWPIFLETTSAESNRKEKYEIRLQELHLDSPMLASDREKFPLVMKIPFEEKNLGLEIYFDSTAKVAKVKVEKKSLYVLHEDRKINAKLA